MTRATAERHFHDYLESGAPQQLGRVFDLVAQELLLVAHHVADRHTAAEDLVQATFLRVIEIADRWDRDRPLLPWLVGILVREARKARERSARSPDPRRVGDEPDPAPPAIPVLPRDPGEFGNDDVRIGAQTLHLPDRHEDLGLVDVLFAQ